MPAPSVRAVEAPRLAFPRPPRESACDRPGRRVRERGHPGGLGEEPAHDGDRDPPERLADPEDVQGVPHDLEAARPAQVDPRERRERDRDARRDERHGALLVEPEGRRTRSESQPESRTTARPTATEKTPAMIALVRTSGHASARLAATDQDRHEADVRHVHPEPRGRARDERELRGQRHDPEERGPQPARHDHLGGERGEHAGRQADHVLPGAAEDVPLVAEPSSWQDRVDRRSRTDPWRAGCGARRRSRPGDLDLGLRDRVELGVGACVLRRGGRALWSVLVVGHASPVSDGEPDRTRRKGWSGAGRRRRSRGAPEGRLSASNEDGPERASASPRQLRGPLSRVGSARDPIRRSKGAPRRRFGVREGSAPRSRSRCWPPPLRGERLVAPVASRAAIRQRGIPPRTARWVVGQRPASRSA